MEILGINVPPEAIVVIGFAGAFAVGLLGAAVRLVIGAISGTTRPDAEV